MEYCVILPCDMTLCDIFDINDIENNTLWVFLGTLLVIGVKMDITYIFAWFLHYENENLTLWHHVFLYNVWVNRQKAISRYTNTYLLVYITSTCKKNQLLAYFLSKISFFKNLTLWHLFTNHAGKPWWDGRNEKWCSFLHIMDYNEQQEDLF